MLDRSGSMADDRKFGLAREAVEQSLRMLHDDDRVALASMFAAHTALKGRDSTGHARR